MEKVLYIDDESINLELFTINFKRDYDVMTCINPLDAEAIIEEQRIKVVITDFKMPEMNGLELVETLQPQFPETIFIMLSGYLEQDINTNNGHVFKHIMKPYKKAQLKEVLEQAFDS